MNFTPRMAPVKAGVFPLVNKDGLPEIAERLFRDIRKKHVAEFDEKQSIGKRYARMDEAGTPFCITVDHDGATSGTATIRHRNTQAQERVALEQIPAFIAERVE
jgi:glycyl-tRNA synthetase